MMIADRNSLLEALKQALDPSNNPKRNFTQSVDVIVTFKGVDMKKGEIKLREIVPLPKAPTKARKVLVVPSFEQLESVKKAQPN
ncbi:MAG: 50S ribosomal protein L1, partial [Sulfolobaceae archaeon]